MKWIAGTAIAGLLVAVLVVSVFGRQEEGEEFTTSVGGGVVTLLAADDLNVSYSFEEGQHGEIVDGRLALERTQVLYDRYKPGHLSFGYVRDEKLSLVDLGYERVEAGHQPTDLAPRTPLGVFHSLFIDDGRFYYLDASGLRHHHPVAQKVLRQFPPEIITHVEPQLGATILIRYRTRAMPFKQTSVVKMQVIDVEPGRYVTLRWEFVGF